MVYDLFQTSTFSSARQLANRLVEEIVRSVHTTDDGTHLAEALRCVDAHVPAGEKRAVGDALDDYQRPAAGEALHVLDFQTWWKGPKCRK
jgi:hypothetical protein